LVELHRMKKCGVRRDRTADAIWSHQNLSRYATPSYQLHG